MYNNNTFYSRQRSSKLKLFLFTFFCFVCLFVCFFQQRIAGFSFEIDERTPQKDFHFNLCFYNN